jgi:uncharacterized protein (DUF4415 family)
MKKIKTKVASKLKKAAGKKTVSSRLVASRRVVAAGKTTLRNSALKHDPDTRELDDADFKKMRPASQAVPEIVKAYKRSRGRPVSDVRKVLTTLRIDPDVLEYYKRKGKGWQSRINATLRREMEHKK